MYRLVFLFVFLFSLSASAQLVDIGISLPKESIDTSGGTFLYKNANAPKHCGSDTLRYAYYKGFSGPNYPSLGISSGFAVGQYFDAPVEVEISGLSFYAFAAFNTDDSVLLTVNLFQAGADTLPYGSPVRSAQIYIDSIQGTLYFSRVKNVVTFDSAYKTDQPFIITIESSDSLLVAMVANSWAAGEGDGENIACATVGGTWYNCLNLNVGGTILDCDFLIEPHVSYDAYADFSFTDCYANGDSVQFVNNSSPVIDHRMYNRLFLNELTEYSFDWRMGDFTYRFNQKEPKHVYNQSNNYQVELHTSLYRYTNYDLCYDTAIKVIHYKPNQPTFKADTPICSGNILEIDASANGDIAWYNSFVSTDTLAKGSGFTTDTLQNNFLIFAEATNGSCKSTRSAILARVIKTPDIPTVTNDSICLNAKANLSAYSNVGEIHWWSDTANTPGFLHIGNVYQTDTLNTSTRYFVQANNQGCLSNGLVEVHANVSANNAPAAPVIPSDTSVCLHDGTILFTATSPAGDSLFWFDKASGGNALSAGNIFNFSPAVSGTSTLYVEANDGQCASTRLGFTVEINQFPVKAVGSKDTLCLGDTAFFDYSGSFGSVKWYDSLINGNVVYDGDVIALSGLTESTTFYLEPYYMQCSDTMRHAVIIDIIPFGTISNIQNDEICEGDKATLSASTDYGQVLWSNNPDMSPILATGNSYTTPSLSTGRLYYLVAQNFMCISDPVVAQAIVNPNPYAGFSYAVNTAGNITFTASANNVSYHWEMGDGNTNSSKSFTHQYKHNNKFNVMLITINAAGCTDTVIRVVTVTGLVTAVEEYGVELAMIYPNPARDVVNIYALFSDVHLQIFNQAGQLVVSEDLRGGMNIFSTNELKLAQGVYTFQLKYDQIISREKLVILP